jgi:hypothetical protein
MTATSHGAQAVCALAPQQELGPALLLYTSNYIHSSLCLSMPPYLLQVAFLALPALLRCQFCGGGRLRCLTGSRLQQTCLYVLLLLPC